MYSSDISNERSTHTHPNRILFLDDNVQDYRLLSLLLKDQSQNKYHAEWAKGIGEAENKLTSDDFAVVIVDYHLGLELGTEAIKTLQCKFPDKPFLLVTGDDTPTVFQEGISSGADNFVLKDEDAGFKLDQAIQFAIKKKEIETSLRRSNKSKNWIFSILSHEINDPLTCLYKLLKTVDNNLPNMSRETLEDTIALATETLATVSTTTYQLKDWGCSTTGPVFPKSDAIVLNQLVDQSIRIHTPSANDQGVYLCKDDPFENLVIGDPRLLSIVIRNLLAETISLSKCGSTIRIKSEFHHNQLSFVISEKPFIDIPPQTEQFELSNNDRIKISTHILDSIGSNLVANINEFSGIEFSFPLSLYTSPEA